jgi:S-formylglutathione hydrolase FrmB
MIPATTRAAVGALLCAALIASCGGGPEQKPPPKPPTRSSEHLSSPPFKVPAPSLAGNLLGDPAELSVAVWLPTDYETSGKRYRTVYYLSGFGDDVDSVITPLGETTDHVGDPLIIVAVDGINALDGSFYRNSPVTGNWADAISTDLVAYVDARYRTVPKAAARGLTGHSMGGYGALQLAFDHPDVFGAVDALSPGLVNDQGMKATQVFAADSTIRAALDALGAMGAAPGASVRDNFLKEFRAVADDDAAFGLAYGAAVAPDPSSRSWIRFPYREVDGKLVEEPANLAVWNEGFGNWQSKIERHRGDLARLRGLRFECGEFDQYAWIPEGCRHLDQVLTEAGIPHQAVEFVGNHETRDRLAGSVLPYLSDVLVSE